MRVELPFLDVYQEGREIFAIWTPHKISNQSAESWLIDSNGLEIIQKDVISHDSYPIGKYLYPVTSMIAFKEGSHNTFIIKNDRP